MTLRSHWWKTADDALEYPERVIAQVMNLGTLTDVCHLLAAFDLEHLRRVLRHAEPGWFNERSWVFWHYRLGLATITAALPPLPIRAIPL